MEKWKYSETAGGNVNSGATMETLGNFSKS